MAFSSGTFTFTSNTFAPTPVTGTTISSTDAASTWSEIATALTTCVLKDGSQTATSSVPFAAGISVTTGITTASTTFALVNTTATTVNFAGAATTLNIGATTGTATFSNPTLATAATTLTLFNTTATTVNFAGAATTLNLGTALGTATLAGSWCPQNSKSEAYGILAADANKHILHPAADDNPRTYTIPANTAVAFPVGTMITIVNMQNVVTIAITTDTMTLMGAGTTGSRTLAENGIATVLKIASTSWVISGTNLT
jgi:hypothetical protein